MIQLNGLITPVNNVYLNEEKFRKITPFISLGAMKNIGGRWGMALEFSHAFKTTKRLQDVQIYSHTVENRTDISKSSIRMMITCGL
jgi:hypothetical protein